MIDGPRPAGDALAVLVQASPAATLLDRRTGALLGQLPPASGAYPRVLGAGGGLLVVGDDGGATAFRPGP